MTITKDIRYIGVNDHAVDLFEGQYVVPSGMSYNSYVILDEKVAVMDTVDRGIYRMQWLDNLERTLGGRKPDYLVVQHMEPDHSANIAIFLKVIPRGDSGFLRQGLCHDAAVLRRPTMPTAALWSSEGDTLCLGKHTLTFVAAPMVHWPEVIVTYDSLQTRFSSPLTASASSVLWTWRKTGRTKPAGTTSASWASTARRCRHC